VIDNGMKLSHISHARSPFISGSAKVVLWHLTPQHRMPLSSAHHSA